MATTAQNIIDKARILLQDAGKARWSDAELLGWTNDGQREVCIYKPDAYVKTEAIATVAGTRQTLPADGRFLIDVIRNVYAGTPSNAVRPIDMRILNDQIPDWHTTEASSLAKFFCPDPRNQKAFYVYPQSDGGANTKLEIVYAATPAAIALNDSLLIDEMYGGAVVDYVVYRAYSKDADYAADDSRAMVHYKAFIQSMMGSDAGEAANEATPILRRANSGQVQAYGRQTNQRIGTSE